MQQLIAISFARASTLDTMRYSIFIVVALWIAGCTSISSSTAPSPDRAPDQLARAERAWLDAYDNDDRDMMSRLLADGFTITFPDGTVRTRQDVISGLDPNEDSDAEEAEDDSSHYTEGRMIRVIGRTAILSGIYVNPGDEGEPECKVASHQTSLVVDNE